VLTRWPHPCWPASPWHPPTSKPSCIKLGRASPSTLSLELVSRAACSLLITKMMIKIRAALNSPREECRGNQGSSKRNLSQVLRLDRAVQALNKTNLIKRRDNNRDPKIDKNLRSSNFRVRKHLKKLAMPKPDNRNNNRSHKSNRQRKEKPLNFFSSPSHNALKANKPLQVLS